MIRKLRLVILFLLGIAFLSARLSAGDEAPQAEPDKKGLAQEIDRLIRQLNSDSFETREKASARLEKLGEAALPALEKAIQSGPSLEVRHRAENIATQIRNAVREQRLARRIAEGRKQAVDQFIEQLLARKGKVAREQAEECWKVPVGWAEAAADIASRLANQPFKVHAADFGNLFRDLPLVTEMRPETHNTTGKRIAVAELRKCFNFKHCLIAADRIVGCYNFEKCVILADRITESCNYDDCLVICGQGMHRSFNMKRCLVFVNGNLDSCPNYEDTIVFCNGDIVTSHNMKNDVVLATGTYRESYNAHHNLLQVKAVQRSHNPEHNVFVNIKEQELNSLNAKGNLFLHTDRGPLQVFRFFELRDVGLEVAGDTLGVARVLDGKPFARAGFRKGDRILTVDRADVSGPEELRCLLRRKAPGETAAVTVARGGQVVTLTVRF
jgi:hypothetical protein